MSRPIELDLTSGEQRWRDVPMPGANQGLSVVPLASSGDTFAILTRFPAGFERSEPGGYLCAEEFLVLDGAISLEGQHYERGDLTFVPSHYLRTTMTSASGCTVLAWFGGPAMFRTPDELGAVAAGPIVSVRFDGLLGEDFMVTSEARWSVGPFPATPDADAIDLDLSHWQHGTSVADRGRLGLLRTPVS